MPIRNPDEEMRKLRAALCVPGAKLVKAFNQLPLKVLASPLPDNVGRRVVFVSSDHEDASATVADLAERLGFCRDRSRQDC